MSLKKTLETPNNIKYDVYLTWLTEDTVRKISADQKEPEWMLELRLKSLEIYNNMPMPKRWPDLTELMPLIEGSQHEIASLNKGLEHEIAPLNKGGRGDEINHLPYNKKNIQKAKSLRKNMTKAEKKLWYEYLKNLNVRVLRQRPIDEYIVDFYIASKKLVIEIDWDTHWTDEEIKYDQKRTQKLESYWLKVMRFTNTEIFQNFDAVCGIIENVQIPPTPLEKGGLEWVPTSLTEKEGLERASTFLFEKGGLEWVPTSLTEKGGLEWVPTSFTEKGGLERASTSLTEKGGLERASTSLFEKGDNDWLVWYARPSSDNTGYATNRDDVPQEIKDKFDKLWIPEAEKKYLAGAWWQMDSVNFYHKIKEKWAKVWVIFEDMPTAIQTHPELVKKYFMKLVPPTDHKFAALHWAVRSWWTFIYVPKWVKVDEPLQAYFRMNTYAWWQFEHTLIIIDDDAECNYIEWCSAPKYDKSSIHTGLVEIFVGKNSKMKYASVENWSTNTYNLNTKRALVEENSYMERVSWNLWSQTTMLYPCSILKWDNSKTEMFGIVLASKGQNQDIWSKVIHIGKNTSSNIVSKSISKDWGISTYRGLVSISKSADNAVSNTQCDAFILDKDSVSITIPTIKDNNGNASISHEASTWKIDESKLFYLSSRGIEISKATSMIVNWFFSQVSKKLPLEYAWELNTLIDIEMENSVW